METYMASLPVLDHIQMAESKMELKGFCTYLGSNVYADGNTVILRCDGEGAGCFPILAFWRIRPDYPKCLSCTDLVARRNIRH